MLNETTKKLTISPLKAFAAIFLFSLASMIHAQDSNLLTGNLSSVGMAGRSGVVITLSIVSPLNRTWNGTNVSNDPLWATSSVPAGDFQFRNVIWGKYRLQAADSSGTLWTLYVGTNTVGTVPIASLITNAAALPPSPATNYYTQVQIDALIAGVGSSDRAYARTNALWGTNLTVNAAALPLAVYWVYSNSAPLYGILRTNFP